MKTTSPFPMYDRLITSGKALPNAGMKLVDARQAIDYVGTQDHIKLDADHFGPVVPPYQSLWFETSNHLLVVDEPGIITGIGIQIDQSREGGGSIDMRTGATHDAHTITIWLLVEGVLRRHPIQSAYTTHADGRLNKFFQGLRPADIEKLGALYDTEDWRIISNVTNRVSIAALFAISLMHCRNVKQTPATYQPQQRRKTSRKRPAIDYHIIELPAPRGGNSSNPGDPGETGLTRLHTVRGHFKTYTAEKPLMGHIVGTYWWSHHARGNADNGEIISSYKVGANA